MLKWLFIILVIQLVALTLVTYEAGKLNSEDEGTGQIFFGALMAWVLCVVLLLLQLFGIVE